MPLQLLSRTSSSSSRSSSRKYGAARCVGYALLGMVAFPPSKLAQPEMRMHPKHFKAWRWESQVAEYYGESELFKQSNGSLCPPTAVGWMCAAQQRDTWKAGKHKVGSR